MNKILVYISSFLSLGTFQLLAASLDDLTWTITDNKVTITDCQESASGQLDIPENIEGHPVTAIGDGAFKSIPSLTGVSIPDKVTFIGAEAFSSCDNLESVTLSEELKTIGRLAFNSCSSLNSITIPDGASSIGRNAFRSCSSLNSIASPTASRRSAMGLSNLVILSRPPQ